MLEQSRMEGESIDQADFEPIVAPFKLCVSNKYVQFSNSHATNIDLILSGYTTKPQIAEERGVSPHTINTEFRTLYQNVVKIGNSNPESNMSKIKLFLILLRSGAVLQVPSNRKDQTPEDSSSDNNRRTFKIKIQKTGDRYVYPFRITISSSYSEFSSKQQRTINQILSGHTTYKDIGEINGITESGAKKRVGATEDTQNSFRNIVLELLGGNSNQRLGNFEIFLKLFEYGILRQVPVEFNRAILDNESYYD